MTGRISSSAGSLDDVVGVLRHGPALETETLQIIGRSQRTATNTLTACGVGCWRSRQSRSDTSV